MKTKQSEPSILDAMESAADWLCEAHPGTDQNDRGLDLRIAIRKQRAVLEALNEAGAAMRAWGYGKTGVAVQVRDAIAAAEGRAS